MNELHKQINTSLKKRYHCFGLIKGYLSYISTFIENEPNKYKIHKCIGAFQEALDEWWNIFENKIDQDNIANDYYKTTIDAFEVLAKHEVNKTFTELKKILPYHSSCYATFPESNDPNIDPNHKCKIPDFLEFIEKNLAKIELIEVDVLSIINDYFGKDILSFRQTIWLKNLFPKNPDFDELYSFSVKNKNRILNLKIGYCKEFGVGKDVFSIIRKSGNKYFIEDNGKYYEIDFDASENWGCVILNYPKKLDKNILEIFFASYIMGDEPELDIQFENNSLQALSLKKDE